MFPSEMGLRWTKALRAKFEAYEPGTDVEKLLEYIGARSLAVGTALVEIDTQGDQYALTFVSVRGSHDLAAIAPGHISPIPRQHGHIGSSGLGGLEPQRVAGTSSGSAESDINGLHRSGISWMAIYLTGASSQSILDELGLTNTGIVYAPGSSALAGAVLPKWLVIVDHHAESPGYVGRTELLQRLSRPGKYVVACYRSADARESSAIQWFNETRWWTVQHDPHQPEGRDHLDYWGNLFWDFAKIRAAAWKKHRAEPDHGHISRVPLTAASDWTGFTESAPLTELSQNR
ncbi:hypothetical protein [Nocardia sp. NPDC050710]|uniref:hypothetical protein n=1 Tax=Nocardia sp. NPDC050710 TaxID=3157220 RepID=UPI0033E5AB7A